MGVEIRPGKPKPPQTSEGVSEALTSKTVILDDQGVKAYTIVVPKNTIILIEYKDE